jgi:hypothetical protein
MGQILDLSVYRSRRRKGYLVKNKARLERFVGRFVAENLQVDFGELARLYLAEQVSEAQTQWDWGELREVMHEAFLRVFGAQLLSEISRERWFNASMFSLSDVADMCVSRFILGDGVGASREKGN